MKTSLLYGALMAIASAVLTLLLFFLGYHSDPAKMQSAQWIGGVLGIAINVTGIVLGIRARRAEFPSDKQFGYGQALLAGLLVGVCAAFFGAIFQALYTTVINPGFIDAVLQQQTAKLEASGMPSEQVEKMVGFTRMMFNPIFQFVVGFLGGTFWAFVVSLVAAAFLKRSDTTDVAPPLPSSPA